MYDGVAVPTPTDPPRSPTLTNVTVPFRPRRHLISAPEWRHEMTNRFAVWHQIIAAAAA
jgi:hypothetical protein